MQTSANQQSQLYKTIKLNVLSVFILLAVSLVPTALRAQVTAALPAVGTHVTLGNIDGINIEAMVQSPSAQKTALQVACVFEYTDNDIYTLPALPLAANGMAHLDRGLNGIITTNLILK
jgi:hypothetical protein